MTGALWTDLIDRWLLLFFAASGAALVIGNWFLENHRHQRLIKSIPIRVHVNGIRGKSSLVRMIAGALRAGGIETIAKTTGSATRFIDKDGIDHPIDRPGAPTIIEQVAVLRQYADPSTEAVVFECMAINPDYQNVSENKIVQATDGVILNVGFDHTEALGDTIPKIAKSLSNTVPANAHLFVGESDEDALEVMRLAAKSRKTTLHEMTGETIEPDEVRSLGPFVFPENVEIALSIAERHGVSRTDALEGIKNAPDDPGASKLFEHTIDDATLYWVDMFGVNDTGSITDNVDRVIDWIDDDLAIFILLNSREDRPDRAIQFAEFLAEDMKFDAVILSGGYQEEIQDRLQEGGVSDEKVYRLKEADYDEFEILLKDLIGKTDKKSIALIGMANIHTEAADMIREKLGKSSAKSDFDDDDQQ